jgi:argininosuccinate lyase
MTTANKKLSSARLTQPTNAFVEEFTASVQFDQRLYQQDIRGSIAHATMLANVGILSQDECDQIVTGLNTIHQEIEDGQFEWSIAQEDVHMNIEARLITLIGETGKKLHTGRSRNDQVATDVRLYLRDMLEPISSELTRLQKALLSVAEREAETILPGFTHLQTAQPITFGHHMMAWYEMLVRDAERLNDCAKRINSMPLGAAALAGTTFNINRGMTAELLGFDRICQNSLDAVSDRDFAIEFNSFASILMMHLSRFSEELIIWSSAQFDFVDLGDAFCTGSSIMPQKKNPDVPELIRGKTSRVYGNLFNLLTLMKNQPLAYNKDNQEDKEPLFDTIDTLLGSLRVYADMMSVITVKADKMRNAALQGYATATDLADYLVRKGVPFRDAHEVVGLSVAYGIQHQKDLSELSLDELRAFSDQISDDVFEVLTLEGSVAARDHLGGTAPNQVRAAIEWAKQSFKD